MARQRPHRTRRKPGSNTPKAVPQRITSPFGWEDLRRQLDDPRRHRIPPYRLEADPTDPSKTVVHLTQPIAIATRRAVALPEIASYIRLAAVNASSLAVGKVQQGGALEVGAHTDTSAVPLYLRHKVHIRDRGLSYAFGRASLAWRRNQGKFAQVLAAPSLLTQKALSALPVIGKKRPAAPAPQPYFGRGELLAHLDAQEARMGRKLYKLTAATRDASGKPVPERIIINPRVPLVLDTSLKIVMTGVVGAGEIIAPNTPLLNMPVMQSCGNVTLGSGATLSCPEILRDSVTVTRLQDVAASAQPVAARAPKAARKRGFAIGAGRLATAAAAFAVVIWGGVMGRSNAQDSAAGLTPHLTPAAPQAVERTASVLPMVRPVMPAMTPPIAASIPVHASAARHPHRHIEEKTPIATDSVFPTVAASASDSASVAPDSATEDARSKANILNAALSREVVESVARHILAGSDDRLMPEAQRFSLAARAILDETRQQQGGPAGLSCRLPVSGGALRLVCER